MMLSSQRVSNENSGVQVIACARDGSASNAATQRRREAGGCFSRENTATSRRGADRHTRSALARCLMKLKGVLRWLSVSTIVPWACRYTIGVVSDCEYDCNDPETRNQRSSVITVHSIRSHATFSITVT